MAHELDSLKKDDVDTDPASDIEMLKRKLLPQYGGGQSNEPFPEDFAWKQNDFRSEDLEVEE